MRKFKIGDRIEVLRDLWKHVGLYSMILCARKGEKGTIVRIQEYGDCSFLGVKFDNYGNQREDCEGLTEVGYGSWISSNCLLSGDIKILSKKKNNLLA